MCCKKQIYFVMLKTYWQSTATCDGRFPPVTTVHTRYHYPYKSKGWFLQLDPCWNLRLAVTPGLVPSFLSAVCLTHADESCAMFAQTVALHPYKGEVKAPQRVIVNIHTDTSSNSISVQETVSDKWTDMWRMMNAGQTDD